jgi:hypothetical protein
MYNKLQAAERAGKAVPIEQREKTMQLINRRAAYKTAS